MTSERAALRPDVHRLAEAIYAADPPEVWVRTSTAAYLEWARAIVAQYDSGEDYAGHRITEPHDCFTMNCRSLGEEVAVLQDRLAVTSAPREDGWEELLAELADEIERESALYVWPENKELAAKRVAALRLAAARGEPGT